MKVELGVMERLLLLQLIPQQSALFMIRMWDDLRQELHFDAGELDAIDMQQEGEMVQWNEEAAQAIGPKEVEIHVRLMAKLHEQLEQLDKKEEITIQIARLCEKLGYTSKEE